MSDLDEALRLQAQALQMLARARSGGGIEGIAQRQIAAREGTLPPPSADTLARADAMDRQAEAAMTLGDNPRAKAFVANAVTGLPFIGSRVDEAFNAIDPGRGDRALAMRDAGQELFPGTSAAGSATGAVVGSIPLAIGAGPSLAARAAGTVGGRAVQGAALGAAVGGAEGAIYGSGIHEGGRAQNALEGGLIGAGLGVAAGAAAPYVAEGIKSALTSLRGSDVRVIQSQLGVSPATARVIRSALDAGDVNQAAAALNRAGPNAMLADAGQPARELLDAAANAGGRAGTIAREAVDARASAASAQMTQALDRYLGPPQGIQAAQRAVREGTSQARGDAYEAAYSAAIDYSGGRGRAIEGLLRRVPQSAINRANELMRLEGVQSAQIMASVGENGAVTYTRMPDVRQLDYITRALGDVAAEADGAGKLGGTTQLGRAYGNLSTSIRNILRREVPEYGQALDTAADAIRRVQAIDLGASMMRPGTTREQVAQGIRGMSRAEREALKQGIRQQIDDTLANVTRTATDPNVDIREGGRVLRDMSSRAAREKLQIALGGPAARALTQEIEQAAVAYELRAAIAANSRTAIRQSIQGGVEEMTRPGMVEVLGQGKPIEATQRVVQLFTGSGPEAQQLRQMGVYEEIARVLTQTRGADAQRALAIVQRAMNGQAVTEQQAAIVGRAIATTGALSGNREGSRLLTTP